jgi:ribosomal protein S18 acetylase RimI-like enzyme
MIRAVVPDDLDEIVVLSRSHAEYEGLPYEDTGQAPRLGRAFFGDPPDLFGWVVANPATGRLDGYMTAVIEFATWPARPFVYMDTLFLRAEARGKGSGQDLIRTLQAFAAERGIAELQWHTPPDNELGIGFYRRLGATELPKRRFFLPAAANRKGD